MKMVFTFFSALTVPCLLCLMPLSLPACLGEPPSADWSLLTGEPCEPPCWQGLTPGESTMEEVEEFFETSELVGRIIRRNRTGRGLFIYWESPVSCYRARPRSWDRLNSVRINSGTRVLKDMWILRDYDLTLEQLLDKYGPPDRFGAWQLGTPESPYIWVPLYYPERGMIPELELLINDVELRPETKVVRVWYMEPTTLKELPGALEARYPDHFQEWIQDWQGYGPIEVTP